MMMKRKGGTAFLTLCKKERESGVSVTQESRDTNVAGGRGKKDELTLGYRHLRGREERVESDVMSRGISR